jgi:hypothetical protein
LEVVDFEGVTNLSFGVQVIEDGLDVRGFAAHLC